MKHIGSGIMNKGTMGKLEIVMWDAVPDCKGSCPVFNTCIYAENTHKKCDLRKHYTEKVLENLREAYENADTLAVHKIGFMLIPLYQQLITFKINLMDSEVMLKTRVNPLYKEMRDTIRLINSMLNDLNLEDSSGRLGKDGDPKYYENFVDGELDY